MLHFTVLLFENDNPDMEKIFQIAIDKANEENDELQLNGITIAIEPNNAFEASKKLCKTLRVSKAVKMSTHKTSKYSKTKKKKTAQNK